jgi:hypothetical protein
MRKRKWQKGKCRGGGRTAPRIHFLFPNLLFSPAPCSKNPEMRPTCRP